MTEQELIFLSFLVWSLLSSIYHTKAFYDRFLNAVEAKGGSSWLVQNLNQKDVVPWNHPLDSLIVGIRQIGLSHWKSEECLALENELVAWKQNGLSEREGTSLWFILLSFFLSFLLSFSPYGY